jgi:hypothetical protein
MMVPRRVAYPVILVAVVVLVVWLRSQPDRVRVDRFTNMRLGPVRLDAGRTQSLLLEAPADIKADPAHPAEFSLEFPAGASGDFGRCRLRVNEGERRLVEWEGRPEACDWHAPAAGARIRLDAAGTAFAAPDPGVMYAVEFEWLDLPDTSGDVRLWWNYYTGSEVRTSR